MKLFKKKSGSFDPFVEAKSFWRPVKKEKQALKKHKYVEGLQRVDQIWPWLMKNHGDVVAVNAPHATHPETYTYSALSSFISNGAKAFKTLGIKNNDVVALFSENSPRWLIADQGLMRLGAADAVRGASAPVEELRYILEDSGAIALIVQNKELIEKLSLSDIQKDRLKFILQLEGDPAPGVIGWDTFLSLEKNSYDDEFDKAIQKADSIAVSAIATILYTSGTTGKPKGVPLTHANLLHQIRSLACVANPPAGSSVLSVLPIWHSYERSAEYYFFSCACTQSYTTIKHLKYDLPLVRPIVMATVPRLWEAIQSGFDDAVKKMPLSRKTLIKLALLNSSSYKFARRKALLLLLEPIDLFQRAISFFELIIRWPIHAISNFLLWPKVRKQLCGGRLLFAINGGGAIAPHVDLFFEAIGVELLVGYGLTETSPVVSCRRPWRNLRGSSGPPLPETEFKIVDPDNGLPKGFRQRGRVLIRGPQVMNGYLGKPEESAKVLDSHGWFDSGDLGMLLPDGSLVLTGRAKDTIVLSNGENIEPGPLEEILVASSFIDQLMLVGQDEKQLGALLVPNVEKIVIWAQHHGLTLSEDFDKTPGDLELRKLLRKEINKLLLKRPGSRPDERVVGVALVEPFSIENGLLTQTLKQRRERITNRDFDAIAEIYGR